MLVTHDTTSLFSQFCHCWRIYYSRYCVKCKEGECNIFVMGEKNAECRMQNEEWARVLAFCSYIRSHCCARSRIALMPFLCLVAKKWRKKRRQRLCLWKASCAPKLSALSHLQYFGEDEHIQLLRSHFDRKMRTDRARTFAVPFLFEICAKSGAQHRANTFAIIACVHLSCWRFPIKTPTQNLNLHDFAPLSGKTSFFRGALRGSKGY